MKRYIAIIYLIIIDNISFTGISIHEISKDEDMFVFANDYITKKGAEKIFNTYFINKGQAEIKIIDVRAISKNYYEVLHHFVV